MSVQCPQTEGYARSRRQGRQSDRQPRPVRATWLRQGAGAITVMDRATLTVALAPAGPWFWAASGLPRTSTRMGAGEVSSPLTRFEDKHESCHVHGYKPSNDG